MLVDIYKAKRTTSSGERIYVFVEKGKDLKTLPPDLLAETGELEFEKEMEIRPGEKRIALDTDEAIDQISNRGYHLEAPRIESTVTVGGRQVRGDGQQAA